MIFFLQMFVILAACRLCGWAGAPLAAATAGDRRDDRGRGARAILVRRCWRPDSRLSCFRRNRSRCCTPWRSSASASTCSWWGSTSAARISSANAPSAVAVSISGIVVPFLVAIVGTPWLMSVPDLFAAGVSRFNATLFLGAAIAITAFPVLARIIHDRGLEGIADRARSRCLPRPSVMPSPGACVAVVLAEPRRRRAASPGWPSLAASRCRRC